MVGVHKVVHLQGNRTVSESTSDGLYMLRQSLRVLCETWHLFISHIRCSGWRKIYLRASIQIWADISQHESSADSISPPVPPCPDNREQKGTARCRMWTQLSLDYQVALFSFWVYFDMQKFSLNNTVSWMRRLQTHLMSSKSDSSLLIYVLHSHVMLHLLFRVFVRSSMLGFSYIILRTTWERMKCQAAFCISSKNNL